ncbi:capsular biosynthesis protein [Methylobacterium sp. NEAU 140]|uniref:capsule biosynthesis protein n=1 Tax=Methylobacterium sp. NEAU 140 TaxID=3064945 RepID=UPI00273309CB|nr:capsular biosynthesis protein [Methylobacterium sp. NEAU 140]MDP4023269.1 capsular biosynthesis protein [Methylobacterium sp. NEAU 140]
MLKPAPDAQRDRPATFLFLQGIASPFFSDLGRALRARGHDVRRINLCPGDWLFWRGPADNYRGPREAWGRYLEDYVAREGVTDVVLFGDCRPFHRAARMIAETRGLRVHVFEEGYIRPNWITCELGGVNGFSSLPRRAEEVRALARRLPQPGRAMPSTGDMARRSVWDVGYNLANVLFPYLYPHFRSHRPTHIAAEYAGWVKKFSRRGHTRREAARCGEIYNAVGCDYFLLPLQLDSDYQIRVHSPFLGVEGFMDRVIKSFADTSKAPTRLLVKLHPLDSGLINWRKFARASARRHGVSDRLDFIDGGDLPSLIAGARGVVIVNSTVGMLSLEMGRPTHAVGTAIYNMPGLTHQGDLDRFWTDPTPPDMGLMADFRRVVLHRTQVNGGFFSASAIERAVAGSVPRIESALPDAMLAAARVVREAAERDGELAPVY